MSEGEITDFGRAKHASERRAPTPVLEGEGKVVEFGRNAQQEPPEVRFSEIREGNPALEEHFQRVESQGTRSQEAFIFGVGTLETIFSIRNSPFYNDEEKGKLVSKELAELKEVLAEKQENAWMSPYVEVFIRKRRKDVPSEHRDALVEDWLNDPRSIPDNVVEDMLSHHIEELRREQTLFEAQLPKLISNFRKRIEPLIEKGYVNRDVVEERISRAKMVIYDPLRSEEDAQGEGFHFQNTDVVGVRRPINFTKDLEEVITHEWFHLLSGRVYVGVSRGDYNHAIAIRAGFMQDRFPQEGKSFSSKRNAKYSWLNEAMTQELTVGTLGIVEKFKEIYGDERDLFSLLMKKGKEKIPFDLFLRAYFENDDPQAGEDQRLERLGALYGQIRESYEPGFLDALDLFVHKYGVNRAISAMNHNWKMIPAIVKNVQKEAA